MVAVTETATLQGVDACPIQVEIELTQGLPYFAIIGMGDTAVQEARYRIQSALRASRLELPHRRVTINLAPAGLKKDGAGLDLPMALGLLLAAGHLSKDTLAHTYAVGELALSGSLRGVRGILATAALARTRGVRRLIVPLVNGPEASVLPELEVIAADTLLDVVKHLRGESHLPRPSILRRPPRPNSVDLAEVKGQPLAKRALEIAAAGRHNLLLIGPPGTGKTMLARRLPTILPPLSPEERIEVTKVWSAAGLTIGEPGIVSERPFRAPHQTVSEAALVGGGSPIRPGEISLAHRGVLFLDEMPQMPKRVLESLRQPLEDREVVVTRVRHSIKLPADFMLVAAANPCPCGWLGHTSGRCQCREEAVHRYGNRISGPLLDRIDLVVEVPALDTEDLMSDRDTEASAPIRERVTEARQRAYDRQRTSNHRLFGRQLRRHTPMNGAARRLLEASTEALELSARSYDRVLKIARTIADLALSTEIQESHLAEAIRYRQPIQWSR